MTVGLWARMKFKDFQVSHRIEKKGKIQFGGPRAVENCFVGYSQLLRVNQRQWAGIKLPRTVVSHDPVDDHQAARPDEFDLVSVRCLARISDPCGRRQIQTVDLCEAPEVRGGGG